MMAPGSVRSLDVATTDKIGEATRNATTIAELIATIPHVWRPVLGDYLTKKYRLAQKLCTVQNTLAQYHRHAAEKSFPAPIRNSIKDPKIQFSKEFLGTSEGAVAKTRLENAVLIAQKSLLAEANKQKEAELTSLQSALSYDGTMWRKLIAEAATRVASSLEMEVSGDADSPTPIWTGGQGNKADVAVECSSLWSTGRVWHFRAVALARSAADRTLIEKTKTMSLKAGADVTMKDTGVEPMTKDVVRDEVTAQLRGIKAELAKITSTLPGKRRGPALTLIRPVKKVRTQGESQERSGSERLPSHKGRSQGESREGKEEGREVTTSAFFSECSKDFRPWLADTYPKLYNSLSLSSRVKIAFACLRLWEADTVRTAAPGVFKHPDVSLPADVEYMLAVNHKFILHQAPEKHDVTQAKVAFRRTVRNRWFFRDKVNKEFIPKFHVPNPHWNPPEASVLIEQGLDDACAVIDSQISRALASAARRPSNTALTKWSAVREFLSEKQYLAKLTDKNLGLAVFPVMWYDANNLVHLSDMTAYESVLDVPLRQLTLTLHQELPSWRLPPAMEKYIRIKTLSELPEFHTIPKVHKTPWKPRPIIPSHSWMTSTTSTVLDHLCQPLLQHMPWVVASSKEVIAQIEAVRVPSDAPVWIITGDVTACYTNIPPKHCAKVLAGAWQLFQSGSSISSATIRKMVRFVMDNNYFQYRGQKFRQKCGLAMGTACAPVVANTYMAYFERKSRVVKQDGVLLYVRYLDDILCLFQGTKEEVTDFCSRFRLGQLTVTWFVHRSRNEFLDIELLRIPGIGLRVCHTRLFRKLMNRHLYIPWSSAHPLHVKKGFVKAELTRFAILCSKVEYFADARKEFYGNLRRRGYPSETLVEWFKQVQYDNRAVLLAPKQREEEPAPLMLSGHYNPVWDFVDVNEVIAAARRSWVREELPESLQGPLIRSLGRTTSLFDLLSAWNKTTLLTSSTVGSEVSPLQQKGSRAGVVVR